MKRLRDPQWVLILVFVAILVSVPVAQVIIELSDEGGGVRALDIFNQAPTSANLRAYEHALESASWAARWGRPWIQFAEFRWLGYGGEKAVLGRDGWVFYKPGLNYMLAKPEHSSSSPDLPNEDPLPAILDFRDQLAARGIHLLLMPVPNKETFYPDKLTARSAGVREVLAPRTQELLARLRAAHVEVLNLFEHFAWEPRQPLGAAAEVPLYLAQDTHWSPRGVNVAAREAASRLRDLGWIGFGPMIYRERPAPVQRIGDIIQMLRAPMIERGIKPETVPAVQIIRADNNELYKDGADAEVLVLGDSFMRIYQEDEPRGAGFIAHLAKELGQPLMGLVNDGGGSTLVRQELRGRPLFLKNKKVVLWEFVERDIGLGLEGWKKVGLNADAGAPGK